MQLFFFPYLSTTMRLGKADTNFEQYWSGVVLCESESKPKVMEHKNENSSISQGGDVQTVEA